MSALLLGLVYMHGVSAEGVLAHVAPGASAPVSCAGQAEIAAEDVAIHQHDEHGASHPGEECLPGQPQPGPEAPDPGPTPTAGGAAAPLDADPTSLPRGAGSAAPPLGDPTRSTVLRI
ncbi:hypothetical protein [Streptomyces hainanensis]|uniref:Uncharacterized protein n=1 Tax=Streptomyces hainanensis TaxID=402648 RepID=A0A4R4T4S0_9ACTN|nr:hypothetical protein [Streptomyces hainanensis]TDC71880.1 hypothetical protein E1283_22950 [Streptomyces hainanensis]